MRAPPRFSKLLSLSTVQISIALLSLFWVGCSKPPKHTPSTSGSKSVVQSQIPPNPPALADTSQKNRSADSSRGIPSSQSVHSAVDEYFARIHGYTFKDYYGDTIPSPPFDFTVDLSKKSLSDLRLLEG